MAKIELLNLEKTFSNGNTVIDNLNLTINDGEFMVFVGPSGCSKSTTLRIIAGLEDLTSGQVLIDGVNVEHLSPKDRGISMVFQSYALYPHMNTFNNMAFGLKISKMFKDKIKKVVTDTIKILDLQDYSHKKPKELSGGQRQRVAIGRSIVRKPKVFLFDEPLSNLDAKLRTNMRVQIKNLHYDFKKKDKEITSIYVTHDQIEAMSLGDRICVMNFGKIMQVDTPINLYERPKNKFVAGFIGNPPMNLNRGNLYKTTDRCYVEFENNTIELKNSENIRHGTYKIWFGIRPEDIYVDRNRLDNLLEGRIISIENMGNEVYVYFVVANKTFISRMSVESAKGIKYGDEINFSFDIDKIHLFDFFTEERI